MNKKIIKLNIILLFSIFSATGRVCGWFSDSASGKASAQFLKIGIGAREIAMGEAVTSAARGPESIYWNPASTNENRVMSVSGMYVPWLQDTGLTNIALSRNMFGGRGSAGITYFSAGELEMYDNLNNRLDSGYTAYDLSILLSFARRFSGMDTGLSFKLLNSKIEEESSLGFAVDGGIVKSIEFYKKRFNYGVSFMNLGPGMKFVKERDPLPFILRTGVSTSILNKNLLLSLDAVFPNDEGAGINGGAEYCYEINGLKLFTRAGYRTGEINSLDALAGFSAGTGIYYNDFKLDYAWRPYWKLGNTHRISAGYKYGEPLTAKEKERRRYEKYLGKAKNFYSKEYIDQALYYILLITEKTKEMSEANMLMNKIALKRPDDSNLQAYMADIFFKNDNYDKFLEFYERYVKAKEKQIKK